MRNIIRLGDPTDHGGQVVGSGASAAGNCSKADVAINFGGLDSLLNLFER